MSTPPLPPLSMELDGAVAPKTPTKRAASPAADTLLEAPESSAKKRKTHHTRAENTASLAIKPGEYGNGRSFTQFHKREGDLAAYLTYSSRRNLRRLAMSAYVLVPHIHSFQDRGSKQVRMSNVLNYIRDCPEDMEDERDPREAYPKQSDGAHALPRMALALCQMRRRIEKTVSCRESSYSEAEQDAAQKGFEQLTGREPPSVDIGTVAKFLRTLGPFTDYGECDLEAYNRCFQLVMYASFSANNSTWVGRFGSPAWDEECNITRVHLPLWMGGSEGQAQDAAPDDPLELEPNKELVPLKEPKEVSVVWKYNYKAQYAREFWTFLEEEGFDLGLQFTKTIRLLSPGVGAEEFCDQVRAAFNLVEIQGQLKTLQLRSKVEYPLQVMSEDWEKIQAVIWGDEEEEEKEKEEAEGETQEKPVFWATFRQSLPGEIIWAHEGPPGLTAQV